MKLGKGLSWVHSLAGCGTACCRYCSPGLGQEVSTGCIRTAWTGTSRFRATNESHNFAEGRFPAEASMVSKVLPTRQCVVRCVQKVVFSITLGASANSESASAHRQLIKGRQRVINGMALRLPQ